MIDCDLACQTWKPGGYALVIECAAAVLEQIRKLAVDGFNAFGHGGLEIGGVLYGSREGELVRIAGAAPIACEHARGPGFVLSAADEEQLRAQLRDGAPEPGLVPVGWFCSHTRSGIALSEADRDLYERFFGEPWQIALLVKPTRWGPARAGLFFREKDGVLRCESSSVEFEIEPRKEALPEPPAAIEEVDTTSVPPAAEAEVIAAPEALEPQPSRGRGWWWTGGAAAAALAAFSVYAWTLRPPEPAGLGLHTYELAGQVRIEWDRHAAAIGRAAGGLLEIDD
ncbi:MAG TPA: hypothetical protein VJ732_16780, partial [Bryobacteraceae bacterium]|nr:hypothetical protein [Bryobacteraceae bacterium]